MNLPTYSFNPYKSVKNGQTIRKQAFGVSIDLMNKMKEKLEDSGFVVDSEIQRNGALYWRQMVFVGRKKRITEGK